MEPTARDVLTLSVDCGGSGIKAGVLDASGTAHAPSVRVETPYPLSPDRLVRTVADIARGLPSASRISLGMPGMIRHGVVIATPHYINRAGPRTRPLPELVDAWQGHDLAASLERELGIPAIVVNDAELHGAGVIAGAGLELVLTLGTGLGSAHYDGGRLAPHLELSHAPVRRAPPYDAYIGEPDRRRLRAERHRPRRCTARALRPCRLRGRQHGDDRDAAHASDRAARAERHRFRGRLLRGGR